MYKILKSTPNGIDELELEQLEKGCWIDIVSPSPEELHEIAAATKIQLDFLTAALDEEEKSRIETEDDQILILVDIPFLRSNKDYDTLPLGIIIAEDFIVTVCLEPNAVVADFSSYNVFLHDCPPILLPDLCSDYGYAVYFSVHSVFLVSSL